MFKELFARARQGHHTIPYPRSLPVLPDRLRAAPELDPARCPADCRACVETCPTAAILRDATGPILDLGRCLFCGDCAAACPANALRFTPDHRLATRSREALVLRDRQHRGDLRLEAARRRLFGRSLKLRQVSAAGCNACEADLNVLTTIGFDLGRFGIQFVASPRHADGIVVTGPVSENMKLALEKTYAAVPAPKLVIAVGACAIAGGPFAGHAEVRGGVSAAIPVPIDLFVPGCPPHPMTILDGLLGLLGRGPR
ncbi:MAG: 4Fe-4S binding protein [Polyangiaceae bacterium]|nr:4Fe-4S binding protein [Polyangiaceae bacterium]